MKGFHCLVKGVVEPRWIDFNGHMNVVYYLQQFDRALAEFIVRIGIDPLQTSIVAARINLSFRREMFAGEGFEVWSAVTGYTARSISITHRMTTAGVNARCDMLANPFNLHDRKAMPVPEEWRQSLDGLRLVGAVDPFRGLV